MKIHFTYLFLLFFVSLFAQPNGEKKTMDNTIYHKWKKIETQSIANDGQWVAYNTRANTEGDALLYVWNAARGTTQTFERGEKPTFTDDSQFLVFSIKQPLDSLKAKRRKKVKDEDLPKDSLAILNLATGEITKIANIKSFAVPQKWAGYIAYQYEIEKPVETKEKPKKAGEDSTATKPKAKPKAENKDNGTKVVLHNLGRGARDTFPFAVEYVFAKRGKHFLVADTGLDSINVSAVHTFDCEKGAKRTIFQQRGKYKQLSLDESGAQAAFIADLDTTKERVRPVQLFYWSNKTTDKAKEIARSNADFGTMSKYLVSENAKPTFSQDGSKLYFGVAPQPVLNDTMLLPEEITNVEVWHYQEARIHTQQKVRLEQERKKSYAAVYFPNNNKTIPLSNPTLPDIDFEEQRNLDVAVSSTSEPYLRETTWEGGGRNDIYTTDLKTGNSTLIASKIRGNATISPAGKYVFWYNELDSAWFAHVVSTKSTVKLTDNKTVKFYDEENDVPDAPNAYGGAGWLRDDKSLLIYDQFDIWKIDPLSKEKPVRLTNGRATETIYRYIKLDNEERYIEPNATVLLHTTNDKTKAQGYAQLNLMNNTVTQIIADDYAYSRRPMKAQKGQSFVFTKQNFKICPDLLYTTDFKTAQRISDINPQQSEYSWGSMELVEWTALDGQKLRGMLVKPEGFDPKKKYPMIVNFYEKSTNELNTYRTLEPLRSQINYSFYANRGYLIFNPDIPYRNGYPGESCLNSVLSGVTYLMNQGFVDEKRIGLQGHSWGGYQAAYLVTKTDIFKCAEAGAPVVNMFSAYSGIRWESGVMRQFQYEHQQSRIGGSIWEYPMRYFENSPLFSMDKVNTPVLILHNDKDGAVPWYQGIEMYGALRRLNKPTWLLNYNDEPHWPVKLQNRLDFQTRMQQFFDYYLKDAPMPRWMQRGVPAMEKGILQGLELERK
jgi:dipeptidyl aminopeptidase/acylaminoacyl peptidase